MHVQTTLSILSCSQVIGKLSKKKAMLDSLDKLTKQVPSLLEIDPPCAQREILDARTAVEELVWKP